MFIATESIPSSFRGFTLIMPAVSVGNVGQLATDLIISTLSMPRVGYIYTDCLIPMAGNNPYPTCADDAAELSTNAEVYCLPDVKLAVLQIRAPFVQRKSRKFRKLIVSWIKSSGFDRTVVLSSSHAYQRDDQQLLGAPLRYLLSPVLELEAGTQLNTLEWREMERVSAFPGINDSDKRLYIPGGGITKGLYTDSCSEGIKMAVLLIFCSEGDNIPDAFALVNYLNDWLHLVDKPPNANAVEGPRVLGAAFWKWDPPCNLLNSLSCVLRHMAEGRMLPSVLTASLVYAEQLHVQQLHVQQLRLSCVTMEPSAHPGVRRSSTACILEALQ